MIFATMGLTPGLSWRNSVDDTPDKITSTK